MLLADCNCNMGLLTTWWGSHCKVSKGYDKVCAGVRLKVGWSHCRVEYQTWAGMIVTQYGRIPGDLRSNMIRFGGDGSHSGSPPRQSAALDKLQRYYGTGDTCSEPEDFKPGAARCPHCCS